MLPRLIALAIILGTGLFIFSDRLSPGFMTSSEQFVAGIGGQLSDAVYDVARWVAKKIDV